MEQSYLLKEGLVLMVIGMGFVYAFLTFMIWVMSFSRFFERFAYLLPDSEPAVTGKGAAPAAGTASDLPQVAVAIAAAKRR